MRRFRFAALTLFFWLATLPNVISQTVTGSVTGIVKDPAGAVIVGAPVQLINNISQQTRTYKTNRNGSFKFVSVLPGTYTISITQPGFKTYKQNDVALAAQENLDLHTIALSLGSVSTSVEVQAAAAHVQTDTSNHSIDINLKQIQNTPLQGRSYQGIIKDLPGVQDLGSHNTRGWGSTTASVNGGQQGQVLVTLDGIAAQDSGAPGLNTYQAPSVDAIAQVTLLVGNYDAQYGSRNGGQVNITIKSGTPHVHGSLYYYFRNEDLNANEFFNNARGIARPTYRYQNPGGTLGGPVPTWLIPGVSFNKNRNRLFFFFSYDYLHNSQTSGTNSYTMPTALERQGDFSQSFNTDGSPIIIRNPLTGAPFPGNRIPPALLSPIGTAMLNRFPLPNATDPTGQRQYNYQFTPHALNPREDKILRVDYNISQNNTMFVRLLQDYQDERGYGAILGALGDGWGQFPHSYHIPSAGVAATYIHTFSPTLVNELTWGINKAHQQNTPTDEALYKASLLPLTSNGQPLNLPTIFGNGVNTMNLDPNVQFGLPSGFTAQSAPAGIPNLPAFGFDSRWPFDGTDSLQTLTNNITWVKGAHTIMAGFYYEHDARNVSVYSTYGTEGTYYFGSDLGNPVDTGDPFANAAFGSVYGYGQDNIKQINRARYKQYEWFVQDTWKVTPHFTLDYGMRFQWLGPLYSSGATLGIFDTSKYDPATVGQLLYPYCTGSVSAGSSCPSADKRSINLNSGVVYPYVLQGTFDPATYPAGSVPFSGISQHLTNLWNAPPIQYNPRIGFAWDVFGNGRTAMRGGFGIFHGRYAGVDTIGASGVGTGPMAAPPHFQAPIILDQTIADLGSSPLVFTPQNVNGGSLNYKPPETYDWSFGIQQNLGKGIIMAVTYIGNVAHHQWNQTGTQSLGPGYPSIVTGVDFNAVAPLTTWTPTGGANPKYLDPTSGNGGTASFYSTNLIRALSGGYQGWGAIKTFTQIGESLYDALQVQVNRRVGSRLLFGVNYTWSKTLLYTRYQWTPDQLNKNVTSNRPQAVNLNFVYSVPNGSKLWNNAFTKQVLDGWQVAGVGTFYSGQPLTVACSAVNAPPGYWTGTPTGGIPFRCQQNGSLWLGSSATPSSVGSTADPRLWWAFNPASFALPPATSLGIGNTPPTLTYGPGVASIDLSVYKEFHLGSEDRVLTIGAQAFNAFNHFNPGAPNNLLALDFKTGANTNNAFGTIQPDQSSVSGVLFGGAQVEARHMVLWAKFNF